MLLCNLSRLYPLIIKIFFSLIEVRTEIRIAPDFGLLGAPVIFSCSLLCCREFPHAWEFTCEFLLLFPGLSVNLQKSYCNRKRCCCCWEKLCRVHLNTNHPAYLVFTFLLIDGTSYFFLGLFFSPLEPLELS